MKFLSFPTLVQREIFDTFDLSELLILSFCSKKLKYLIQAIQKHRLNKVGTVKYSLLSLVYIIVNAISHDSDKMLNLFIISDDDSEILPMEVFGMHRDVPICLDGPSHIYAYEKEQTGVIIEGIHTFLYQFFGPSPDYRVCTNNSQPPPNLKNINSSAIILPENITAEELENCFTASPKQEYIVINKETTYKLSPNSVIYDTDYLDLLRCDVDGEDVLFRFNGKSLTFSDSNLQNSTIIRFLNTWKSDRGFQNLKLLWIDVSPELFNFAGIMESVDIKQSDESFTLKWKQRSTTDARYRWNTADFSHHLMRSSDGVGASMTITQNHFYFVVWSEIENSEIMNHIK
ncbi:hypothetical protein CRE_18196 [Caenorhabditis remanei]|uniref:F-box domain-containing protein n=1 Tax=Caenorhabditis remanei TaxID=31234 RepID=E3NCI5_CAERE|nr:hypothetical protein CRE_18196 [Caenorhabditis remanei]